MARPRKPEQNLPKAREGAPAHGGAASQHHAVTAAHWSGPMPPPAALREFNEIIPGGAERILRMAEAEQLHRQTCESNALQIERDSIKRGQWLGAAVSVVSILGATVSTLVHAHWVATAALVGVPVLGIIRAIVRSDKPGSPG